jgi:hypothetical protein
MPYSIYLLFLVNFYTFSFFRIFWNLFSSADGSLHLIEEGRVFLQEVLGVLTALSELGLTI